MGLKNLAIWVSKPYDNDILFNENSSVNRDNCLAPFHELRRCFNKRGFLCHTYDVYKKQRIVPDVVLFLDIPTVPLSFIFNLFPTTTRKWVVLQECEVVKPQNWDFEKHKLFDKIFTWNDDVVDGERYVKLNFSNRFHYDIPCDMTKKDKFCALVAGNKNSNHPLELYSKRIEAIRWFETNHPGEFDLYGIGWDEFRMKGPKLFKILNKLNRFKLLRQLFAPYFSSYRGIIEIKKTILEKYKFAICYENAKDISGYITEKIFDCFSAGCVPVYWGANNIAEHIPKECFVDKREFDSYEKLFDFLKRMDDNSYVSYLKNIQNYISSQKSYEFTAEFFAKTITAEILKS